MAEFSSNIGSVTNRIRTQDPGPSGPSFLETLANIGSNAVDLADTVRTERRRSAAQRRQAEADAEQATIEGIINPAVLADNLFSEGVSADDELAMQNPAAQEYLRELERQEVRLERTGDNTRYLTAVEMAERRLQNDPTVDLAAVGRYLTAQGLAPNRSLALEQAAVAAERQAQTQYEIDLFNEAQDLFTDEQLSVLGRDNAIASVEIYRAAETVEQQRLEIVQREADMVTAQGTIDEAEREALERQRAEMEANWNRTNLDVLNVEFMVEANAIAAARAEGLGPEEVANRYRALAVRLRQREQEIIGQAEGISSGGIAAFREQVNIQMAVIESYVNDDTYRQVVNEYLSETQAELFQAIPELAAMQVADPSGQMAATFLQNGVLMAIDGPELSGRTAAFIQNYGAVRRALDVLSAPGGTNRNNPEVRAAEELLARVGRGDFSEGTPEETAEIAIPMLDMLEQFAVTVAGMASPEGRRGAVEAVGGLALQAGVAPMRMGAESLDSLNQSRALREERDRERRYSGVDEIQQSHMAGAEGTITPRDYGRRFISAAEYLLNNELSPNNPNPRDEVAEIRRRLFSPAGIEAIRVASQEEPEVMVAALQTAYRLFDAAEGYQPNRLGVGSPRVNFDQETGRFVVTNVREEAGTATWAGGIGRGFSDLMASEANALLDQMLSLVDLDPNISGLEMSDLERRKYLVSGELPEAKSGSSENKTEGASATESGTMEDYIGMTIDQEGGSHSTGYIPTGGSGVTIGAGLDLGQHTADDLTRMGISAPTIEKLEPYLGLSIRAAVEAQGLSPEGLQLTPEEEAEINEAVLGNSYNRARSTPAWGNLSDQSRQALVSMRHWAGQLGANSSKLAPAGTNHVWAVLQREDATDEELVQALRDTLADMPDPTEARYNRIERLILDLT